MPKSIKVLSIKEPHASLLLTPFKTIETRSWATSYRGEIYLHASKSMPSYKANKDMWDRVNALYDKEENRTGKRPTFHTELIYAKAELVDCIEMTPENIAALPQEEIDAGYYEPGRYMWVLKNVQELDPVCMLRVSGHLGIWEYTCDDATNLEGSAAQRRKIFEKIQTRINSEFPGMEFVYDVNGQHYCTYITEKQGVYETSPKILLGTFSDVDLDAYVDTVRQHINANKILNGLAKRIATEVPDVELDMIGFNLYLKYASHPGISIELIDCRHKIFNDACFGYISEKTIQRIIELVKMGQTWLNETVFWGDHASYMGHNFEERVQYYHHVPFDLTTYILKR